MKIVFFGTFHEGRHPRVRVLREGLALHGADIVTINQPSRLTTEDRLEMAQRPWKALRASRRLIGDYVRLVRAARRIRDADVVIVGYLGVLDVHLARILFRCPVVLDHMAPLAGTFGDRRVGGLKLSVARAVDRLAERAADLVLVDTEEHAHHVSDPDKCEVVPVGAPTQWFARPTPYEPPLSIVFFGLYTPLQGVEHIAEAIRQTEGLPVQWTLIGNGQDRGLVDPVIEERPDIKVIDWVDPDDLPRVVAAHDICLGVFGDTPKAQNVVPNKVYQGAAAGCLVITSNTDCQRRAIGPVAILVDHTERDNLATVCRELATDPSSITERRRASAEWAAERFAPAAVTADLMAALSTLS